MTQVGPYYGYTGTSANWADMSTNGQIFFPCRTRHGGIVNFSGGSNAHCLFYFNTISPLDAHSRSCNSRRLSLHQMGSASAESAPRPAGEPPLKLARSTAAAAAAAAAEPGVRLTDVALSSAGHLAAAVDDRGHLYLYRVAAAADPGEWPPRGWYCFRYTAAAATEPVCVG